MNIVFTICSSNYLSQALSLKGSFLKHNPDKAFYIVLADRKPEFINDKSIVEVKKIGIKLDVFDTLLAEYNIIEFNTAIKPFAFAYFMRNENPDNVVYLDPDILIYQSFNKLIDELNESDFILTPHLLKPIQNKELYHLMLDTINTGTYNLGFLGLHNSETTKGFIEWWQEHLTYYGHNRILEGQFYDQKVMNLIPGFYDNVLVSKSFGRNVAEWNLHERKISKKSGEFYINSELLEFFHFSGVKITNYEDNLNQNNLIKLADSPELKTLIEGYISLNKENHYERLKSLPCFFNLQPNIHRASRKEIYLHKIKKWLHLKR
ncbi:MAG: hypothetical protein WEA99_01195 [Brumimicrobium sp.]